MDFHLTKEQLLVRKMYRDFAENEVKPLAAEIDEEERFPMETVEKMAKLGMMGIYFPKEYGGAGADACQLAQFLIHFRNIGADHDLVLLAAAHNTQHTGNLFHLIVFGKAVVFQIQAQACHAMGGILEIGRSTYCRQNLLADLFIVCHTDSSYF